MLSFVGAPVEIVSYLSCLSLCTESIILNQVGTLPNPIGPDLP